MRRPQKTDYLFISLSIFCIFSQLFLLLKDFSEARVKILINEYINKIKQIVPLL
jgi:hypothetical protein